MKMLLSAIYLVGMILAVANSAFAQSNVYTLYLIGYVNTTFRVGDTLFGNPVQNTTNDLLSTLIPYAPDGTRVSLWDPAANDYATTSTFASGGWSANFSLNPGQGAKLTTSTQFTNTFIGYILAPGGGIVTNEADILIPPPVFSGPAGQYLLSCKTPFSLNSARPAFTYVLGRDPLEGEQFTTLDPLTQIYHTTTFNGGGWDDGEPVLAVGEAAFFSVGSVVPEPAAAGLMVLGLTLAMARCRRC